MWEIAGADTGADTGAEGDLRGSGIDKA